MLDRILSATSLLDHGASVSTVDKVHLSGAVMMCSVQAEPFPSAVFIQRSEQIQLLGDNAIETAAAIQH